MTDLHYHTPIDHLEDALKAIQGVTTTVVNKPGIVILRGNPDDKDFAEACQSLNLPVPKTLRQETFDQGAIGWISPDEFFIHLPLDGVPAFMDKAEKALGQCHAAVVDNSGGFVGLNLEGNGVIHLLTTVSHYDFNDFPTGKIISTTLGKAGGILIREQENRVKLWIRWSFADYVVRLLAAQHLV